MRLIDADEYEKRIKPYDTEDDIDKALYNFAHYHLVTTPSADARENVRGEWLKGGEQPYFRKHFHIVVCSVCNKRGEQRWNFCPNCGSDMRGEA